MHEMALMGDIIQLIQEDALKKGINMIERIELVVGEISNAMPDALRMAFFIIKEQRPSLFDDQAELVIVIEEAKAQCVFCEETYKPDRKIAICPKCNIPSGKIISGEAFQVLSYEGRSRK